jgi:hypothetical protein
MWATIVRLVTTAAIAWVGVALVPQYGLLIAGLALTAGAFLEAAPLQAPAKRSTATRRSGTVGRDWAGLVARHGNLSAGRLLVMAPTVVTTIGVAHASRAPESLIVWPVLVQFAALFTSPTTDWESVAATALKADRRSRAPQRLTVWLASTVTALFALGIASGLADLFVRQLLAVPDPAADLGMRWIWVLLPLPAVWLARAYFRGGVMANDSTAWLSYAGLAHAIVVIGVLHRPHTDNAAGRRLCGRRLDRRRAHRGGAHASRHGEERTRAAGHGSRLSRQRLVSDPAPAGTRRPSRFSRRCHHG